jgi:hypothetical protein
VTQRIFKLRELALGFSARTKRNFKLQEWVVGFRAKRGLDSNLNYEMGCGLSSKDSEENETTNMDGRAKRGLDSNLNHKNGLWAL